MNVTSLDYFPYKPFELTLPAGDSLQLELDLANYVPVAKGINTNSQIYAQIYYGSPTQFVGGSGNGSYFGTIDAQSSDTTLTIEFEPSITFLPEPFGLPRPYAIGGGDLLFSATVTPVPEPSTFLLLALGGLALVALSRNQRLARCWPVCRDSLQTFCHVALQVG